MKQHPRLFALSLVAVACLLMADVTGKIRWDQLNPLFRHGTQPYGQASDNTGASGNLPKYNADGSLTDSGIAAGTVGGFYQTLGIGGVSQTQRGRLNVVAGTNITITNTDNSGTNSSDVNISCSGCSGGGGGGNTIAYGTCASLPGSGQTVGNLYQCTDFPLQYIFTSASAAQGYLNGIPVTPPPTCASFTWVNQNANGTCTQSANGPLVMGDNNTGGCCSNQLLVKTAPSTPYTLQTQIVWSGHAGSDGSEGFNIGFALRESSTGKFYACQMYSDWPSPQIRVEHWNSPTSDAGTVAATFPYTGNPIGLKISDDGTNLKCYYSFDGGVHWSLVSSESRTTFMSTGPNQAGLVQLLWGQPTNDTASANFYDYTQH